MAVGTATVGTSGGDGSSHVPGVVIFGWAVVEEMGHLVEALPIGLAATISRYEPVRRVGGLVTHSADCWPEVAWDCQPPADFSPTATETDRGVTEQSEPLEERCATECFAA